MRSNPKTDILTDLFRSEYSRMTAALCRHFGLKHIELAEDIVSETFLKATERWPVDGIPEDPPAWLYAVARNKLKDELHRAGIFEAKVKNRLIHADDSGEIDIDFTDPSIPDSQLAMIFAVCNPNLATATQIALALKILCGFSVQEIADAFLTGTETIKKRLLRGRAALRNEDLRNFELRGTAIASRLETVLRTLYLLFNEGYYSINNNKTIRRELCFEGVRLTHLLVNYPETNTPSTQALLALMCYQSSRLEARMNDLGELILFDDQDRHLWDKDLIETGNIYLVNACSGSGFSRYHLEAAIAYWHATCADDSKWQHILMLYNRLIVMEYAPVTALNRTFAFAKVYGHQEAIREAEKIRLEGNNHYHALLGFLYSSVDTKKSASHYQRAIALTNTNAGKQTLKRLMSDLYVRVPDKRSMHVQQETAPNYRTPDSDSSQ